MSYSIRTTRLTITDPGGRLFDADATHLSVDDSGAGEFLVIQQYRDDCTGECDRIEINPGEWPVICQAVGILLDEIEAQKKRVEGVKP